MRDQLGRGGVKTKKKRGYDGEDHRFETFYDFREPIAQLAPHRFLAMRRGESEHALSLAIDVDDAKLTAALGRRLLTNPGFMFRRELEATVTDCYARLLKPSISTEVLSSLREVAEKQAISVFATNLGELLLAPPASRKTILGIDPGFRTGCKVVVIDSTSKLVAHSTVYPTAPRNDVEGAERELLRLIDAHDVKLIAIGNGTASRETAAFCARLERARPRVRKVVVNESGASIYSAGAMAREEFPDLDLTVRGAISIARRLQDPLAELVKIDPKSIGGRAVSARRQPGSTQESPRPSRPLIGEPGRRPCEFGFGNAAIVRIGDRSNAGTGNRDSSGSRRPVRDPPGPLAGPSLRRESVRAECWLPASTRRSRGARRDGGAPRELLHRGDDLHTTRLSILRSAWQ